MTLPNFMIIGVAKAGTTSLYRYLDQHPQVFMCPMKGTNFFGYEDARNWHWTDEGDPPLLRNFPVRTFEAYEAAFAGVTDEIAIGEASPQYFRCPTAARRIREVLPHARLIASLRNPADRAFSGYLMRIRRGEAAKNAYEDLTPEASHVKEGFYYRRLRRFYDLFPREQIKIILFEEFKKEPVRVVQELFEFLEVDPEFVPDTSARHNPAAVPKSRLLNRFFFHPTVIRTAKALLPGRAQDLARQIRQQNLKPPPKFPADLRARLLQLYRDDILQVEALIDRDLSIWLEDIREVA
ncbi:sulfotransferase [Litorilinea aerophila]|uniref:Sulfotransferase n=1 Tax=Litorilinea aerophila TaxID=1204385 RepID=A0A540V9I4_9CHLR|nr:sulfotransferase [Litorilinea aerophila]MCC9078670.1 sulfotransferase [Litorilinea aerophila]OUC06270.1 hypothetical protein RY27_22100 [Litorilinea aerophila]